MKHAPTTPSVTTLPKTAPAGLTAGLDWAKDDHVVCVLDDSGEVCDRFTLEHTSSGLAALVRRLDKLGCREIAIERPDGPVVDALLAAKLTVVVISPNQVKNLRSRYGSAGNKDDRFDAYVLADTLRTDRARLRILVPDSPATSPCARPAEPAKTWSTPASRSPTSSALTCITPSRQELCCSPLSTAPSVWTS